jgi:hypothetical protein
MLFSYRKLNYEKNKDWLEDVVRGCNLTSVMNMAVDAVIHDLNSEYMKQVNGEPTQFETDAECTYWQGDTCYVQDDVFKVLIDEVGYLFSHMYIARGHVILVLAKCDDIYADVEELEESMNDLEVVYFSVDY